MTLPTLPMLDQSPDLRLPGFGGPRFDLLTRGVGGGAPPPEIDEIEKKLVAFEDVHRELWRRMDADFDLWLLKPYDTNRDGSTAFPSYTSNAPRTFADKVAALLSSAKLLVKVPYEGAVQAERLRYDQKERFFYGLLNAADERLVRRVEPRLKQQMARFITLRGFIVQRAVLVKRPDQSVFVDITPWDPRRAAWGVGADGLSWAVLSATRWGSAINAEYGADVAEGTESYELIDYYDQYWNGAFVRGVGWVKQPTPHGAGRVPVVVVPVGSMPLITKEFDTRAVSQFGESVFAADRALYPLHNEIMSIYLSLVQKARDRSYALYSPTGAKTLDDNPNEAGGIIPLSSQDKLELVQLPQSTQDAALLAQVVQSEMQQGALPKTVYGDVNFTLSGFAINSLRQSVFSVLQPLLDAMQDAYAETLRILVDQYETGAYEPISVSGRDNSRAYFNERITPEVIRGLPNAEITLAAELPQDDIAKIQMAQAARQGPTPPLPDVDILERIVGVGDVGVVQDAIKEQMAERTAPLALMHTLMSAAENRGRPELAAIYLAEIQIQQLLQLAHLAQAQAGEMQAQGAVQMMQAGIVPPQPGAPPLPGPAQLPAQAAGRPQPRPSPRSVPNRPPGTPRPGGQPPPVQPAGGVPVQPATPT